MVSRVAGLPGSVGPLAMVVIVGAPLSSGPRCSGRGRTRGCRPAVERTSPTATPQDTGSEARPGRAPAAAVAQDYHSRPGVHQTHQSGEAGVAGGTADPSR
jgi:hypothetical protein